MIPRYTKSAMKEAWSDKTKFGLWLQSCLAVLFAQAKVGDIHMSVYRRIKAKAGFVLERIEELDRMFKQDAQAFIEAVKEYLIAQGVSRETAAFFANCITSYDMEDGALSRQICNAVGVIISALRAAIRIFKDRAAEFNYTLCLMITHNQAAGAGYFGLRICNWLDILERDLERIEKAQKQMEVARFSGIVGVYGALNPEIERIACRYLKLKPVRISTQIIHRDRHSELMDALKTCACDIEHIALTLWQMCGYPTCEARLKFDWVNQRGSTGMPHKRNPWQLERLMGLASLLRGYALALSEQIATPHERAIAQSSVERIVWPDATTILHFVISELHDIFRDMEFFPANMLNNFNDLQGVTSSQAVKDLIRGRGIHEMTFTPNQRIKDVLVEAGKMGEGDQMVMLETYDWAKFCVFLSWDMDWNRPIRPLAEVMIEQGALTYISREELEQCFDPAQQLRYARDIYERFDLPICN